MRAWAAALAAMLALAAPAEAQRASQPRLSQELPQHFTELPGAKSTWLDARNTGYAQIVLPVMLDGVTVNAVIDTGAPFSVIDSDYAFEHSYAVTDSKVVASDGQPASLPTTPIRTLRFSGAERAGGLLRVANLSSFRAFGLDVPLILGNDFLACCALELDFEHAKGRLLATGARPVTGFDVPLHFAPGNRYFFTDMQVDGKAIGSVMVDTGGGGALMVSEAYWAAAGLPPPPTTIKLLVLSGPRVAGRAQLDALMLGGATIHGVGTTILPGDAGLLDASHANGVIGANLLQRFHIVIDATAGRMILAPRDMPLGPDAKSTSGVQLTRDGDAVLIFHVFSHSPAERAGLKTGERICSINGQPAAMAPLDWASGMPGRTIQLTLCDDRMVALTLAEFY